MGGPVGPYRSSERLEHYRSRSRDLLERDQAYYCFCTPDQLDAERKEALAKNLPAKYSGRLRASRPAEAQKRVSAGEPAAGIDFARPIQREIVFDDLVRGEIRFHTDVIGDQMLLRSDGYPAYNFAVVVDDGLMGVTHVVRGEDHISNTPRQILIYEALGFALPHFAHVAMVLGPDHTKLSKRHGAVSVDEFRAKGYLPEALLNYLALLSWSPGQDQELMPLDEMARRFSLESVGHAPSVFDEEKLAWVNRHYMKDADGARLAALSVPYLARAGYVVGSPDADAMSYLASLAPIFQTSVDRLEQVPERLRQLFEYSPAAVLQDADARREVESGPGRLVIDALADELADAPRLVDRQIFRSVADRVKQRSGQKGRGLFHPIRLALTGASDGPELDLLVPAIDRGAEAALRAIRPVLGARERARQFADALK